jgi:predicted site-specific integrase-resolvase
MIIDTEDYLSIQEAAEAAGVNQQTFQHFVASGEVKNLLKFKGRNYVHKDEIPVFIAFYAKVKRKPQDRVNW